MILLPREISAAQISRACVGGGLHVLGFAPLTQLSYAKEFSPSPLVHSLSLTHLVDPLSDRNVRFYIGNHDTRVGTRNCFDVIDTLSPGPNGWADVVDALSLVSLFFQMSLEA